jgi:hypothetical protein
MTQAEADQEYLDLMEDEHARRARRGQPPKKPPALPSVRKVNRDCPRWKRIRGSLIDIHGLGQLDLDDYADRIYRMMPA